MYTKKHEGTAVITKKKILLSFLERNMILILGSTIMILVHNSAIIFDSAGVLQLYIDFQKAVC
jgi:hypothetical protein